MCLAASASAQVPVAETLFDDGLAAAEVQLEGQSTPEAQFLLGGTRFLRAIETAFQIRWRMGLTEAPGDFPLLRTGLPQNPSPDAFDPSFIEALFAEAITQMEAARGPLEALDETTNFSVPVDLSRIWLDVNMNGARDAGEGLVSLSGNAFLIPPQSAEGAPAPIVDFDASDAAWLRAYTHMISGFSQLVLAFHPTDVITKVMEQEAALEAFNTGFTTQDAFGVDDTWVAILTIYIKALEGQPDPARTQAAHGHLLKMVQANKTFWAQVAAETDAGREWIPNQTQTSALGIDLPPETASTWQDVLTDVEHLLNGALLIPHWRLSADAGINLERLKMDPPQFDIMGWIHGGDALPYIEKGPRISGANWGAFQRLMGGRGLMFAVMLN